MILYHWYIKWYGRLYINSSLNLDDYQLYLVFFNELNNFQMIFCSSWYFAKFDFHTHFKLKFSMFILIKIYDTHFNAHYLFYVSLKFDVTIIKLSLPWKTLWRKYEKNFHTSTPRERRWINRCHKFFSINLINLIKLTFIDSFTWYFMMIISPKFKEKISLISINLLFWSKDRFIFDFRSLIYWFFNWCSYS